MWEGFTGVSGRGGGGEKGVTAGKPAEDRVRERICGTVAVSETISWEKLIRTIKNCLFMYVTWENIKKGVILKRDVKTGVEVKEKGCESVRVLINHKKEGLQDYLRNVHRGKKSKVCGEIIVR